MNKEVRRETVATELTDVILNGITTGVVRDHCHRVAIDRVYGGNEHARMHDEVVANGGRISESLENCRNYLYYEVYTSEMRRILNLVSINLSR